MKTPCFLLLAPVLLCGCVTPSPPAPAPEAVAAPQGLELLPSSAGAGGASAPVPVEPEVTAPVATPAPTESSAKPLVESPAPDALPDTARILRVNAKLHYALLESSGRLNPGQDVIAFRDGKPIGKLRVSAPRQGRYFSADILDGDVKPGDLVR